MTFSPFHPAFFILGALFVMFGLTAYPGYYALISRQVHNEDVGKTLGSLESIAIAGLAIGSPVYSTIFRAVGSGGKCGKALAKDLVWLPWALAAVIKFLLARRRKTSSNIQKITSAIHDYCELHTASLVSKIRGAS